MIYQHVRELVGNTPMLKLNRFYKRSNVGIYAKLEFWNPGGSVKDRIGFAMLQGAIEKGIIHQNTVLVEATAGNTGIGLALAAQSLQLKLILVVPEKFSIEKQQLMSALGAELVITPKNLGMKGAIDKAEAIIASLPQAIGLRQFENHDNVMAHYTQTGPEIYHALKGSVTHFVAGAGSGGTFTGVSRFLKEKNPNIKAFVAEPIGSTMGGGEEGAYAIEGIGNNFVPQIMDMTLVDAFIPISDDLAFQTVKKLALTEGLVCGSSSGAALAAAVHIANQLDEGNIVVVLPDRGDRYLSKGLFDEKNEEDI